MSAIFTLFIVQLKCTPFISLLVVAERFFVFVFLSVLCFCTRQQLPLCLLPWISAIPCSQIIWEYKAIEKKEKKTLIRWWSGYFVDRKKVVDNTRYWAIAWCDDGVYSSPVTCSINSIMDKLCIFSFYLPLVSLSQFTHNTHIYRQIRSAKSPPMIPYRIDIHYDDRWWR